MGQNYKLPADIFTMIHESVCKRLKVNWWQAYNVQRPLLIILAQLICIIDYRFIISKPLSCVPSVDIEA